MIQKIISFSVRNKLVTGVSLLIFIIWGIYSFTRLNMDALPDVTNNQVQVMTYSPNLATQEIEQFVTYPLEIQFKSLQGMVELRSISRSGLSVITIVFKDNMPGNIIRQLVGEKLKVAAEEIPPAYGSPEMLPPTTGLGEIFQYVLTAGPEYAGKYTPMELRTIQDWIIKRQLLGTPGVVEVSSFGGKLKQYEVTVRPERLAAMNLTLMDVYDALIKNNQNTGGSYIDKGPNTYFIRGEGLIQSPDDINSIVVRNINGIPVLVKDIAVVQFGAAPRYGGLTRNGQGEVVGGIVLMQKGENAVSVIRRVKERMAAIEKALPEGLSVDVFIDRTRLIDRTIHTVSSNLLEGALIVIFVLVLFLGNFRAGLIVASVIPLSMLFAVGMMRIFGVSANLMSMGALDFGLIVDGAVIIVESLLHRFHDVFKGRTLSSSDMDGEVTVNSGRIMHGAVFGQIIILIVYIPIFSLSGIEGKMFLPMAQTVSFAIIGALLLSLTYVPWISSLVLNKKIASKESYTDKAIGWLVGKYQPLLARVIKYRIITLAVAAALFTVSIIVFRSLGGEFIPELDEGDFAIESTLRQGTSLPQSISTFSLMETALRKKFPEIKEVVSKIGSSEIPTDPMPVNNADVIVVMKEKKDWVSANSKEEMVEKMNAVLQNIPGLNLSFEHPIQMRFNELIAGVKSDLAIKLFGSDLNTLSVKAGEVKTIISGISGLEDIKVEQTSGMPQLVVKYHRNKIAQYGLTIADVNATLNMAYAGGYAGSIYENERKFDLVVRIPKDSSTDADAVKSLLVPLPNGRQIPISEIADVSYRSGPAQISREDAERRIVVEANVRGRDVEGIVKDIQKALDAKLKLPEGYYIRYGGQFENLQEAKSRLLIAVPVALLLIFFLLYLSFRSVKDALIIYSAIPLAAIGGIFALWIRNMNFSISAGVGFIALFGVAVLNGIVLISYYRRLQDEGEKDIVRRILSGSGARLRPVLATAAVASLGFFPMAFSASAGAEVQKPLATVVIGGLASSTLLTLFVLPVLYSLFYGKKRKNIIPASILTCILCLTGFSSRAQTSLTLDSALQKAYRDHPASRQGELMIQQQEILAKTATTFDPLNINGSYGQMNSKLNDYNIGFSQSFRLPGAYHAEKKLLEQNVNISKTAAAVTKNELTRNVSAAYYNWTYAWQQYRLLSELDSAYRNFERYADKKFNVGETGVLEKTNARAQLAALQLEKKRALSDIAIFQTELQQWMATSDTLSPPGDLRPMVPFHTVDSVTMSANPLMVYSRQQVKVTQALLQVEKAKGLPSFSIGAATQSIDRTSPYAIFSLGASIPLFRNGVRARTNAAALNIQIAEKAAEKVSLELWSAYNQLFQQYTKAASQLHYYESEGLQYANIILNAALKSYMAGNIGYVEYIQNIKEAANIKQSYLATVNEYNQSIIRLNFLLNK